LSDNLIEMRGPKTSNSAGRAAAGSAWPHAACRALLASTLLASAGCGAGMTGATDIDMSGLWNYDQTATDGPGTTRCSDVGQFDLTQSNLTLTGSVTGRGGCEGPIVAFDYVVSGTLSLGRIAGHTLVFQAGDCRYAGTVTGDHVDGTMNCVDHHTPNAVPLLGTWEMSRVSR
jgi:hypothetical protein